MRRELLLLAEIIEAAERIVELSADATDSSLDADRTRREALLWSFTVLGEASSQLDDVVKSAHPDVPWRAATAMRNRIVHGYWQISTSILLATAQDDMPMFLAAVRRVDADLRTDSESGHATPPTHRVACHQFVRESPESGPIRAATVWRPDGTADRRKPLSLQAKPALPGTGRHRQMASSSPPSDTTQIRVLEPDFGEGHVERWRSVEGDGEPVLWTVTSWTSSSRSVRRSVSVACSQSWSRSS